MHPNQNGSSLELNQPTRMFLDQLCKRSNYHCHLIYILNNKKKLSFPSRKKVIYVSLFLSVDHRKSNSILDTRIDLHSTVFFLFFSFVVVVVHLHYAVVVGVAVQLLTLAELIRTPLTLRLRRGTIVQPWLAILSFKNKMHSETKSTRVRVLIHFMGRYYFYNLFINVVFIYFFSVTMRENQD